jgi:hypothetical protein
MAFLLLVLLTLTGVGILVGRMTANTSSGVWAQDLARDHQAAIIDKAVFQ